MSATTGKATIDTDKYLIGLNDYVLSHADLRVKDFLHALWEKKFGAYIFQNDADHRTCGDNSKECFSKREAIRIIFDFAYSLQHRGELEYPPLVLELVEYEVMSAAAERLSKVNSPLVVASLLKYHAMVMEIRMDAYNEGVEDEGATWDVNMLQDGDPRHALFQYSFEPRLVRTLKIMGTEIESPVLQTDIDKYRPETTLMGRVDTLFQSPRFRSLKDFYFTKSVKGEVDTVTWLKKKAHALIAEVKSRHGEHPHSDEVSESVDLLTDSMKTSTTGSILACDSAVFIPKAVEADRLLTNLFKHHFKQLLHADTFTFIDACVDHIPEFTSKQKSPAPKQGGGRK